MDLQNLQQEIENRLKDSQVDVLMALFENIKELANDLSNDVVQEYRKLILVYTHCKIYQHRLKRWIEDYHGIYSPGTYSHYNRKLLEEERLTCLLLDINKFKNNLRDKLTAQGVDFSRFHPHISQLDYSFLPPSLKIV